MVSRPDSECQMVRQSNPRYSLVKNGTASRNFYNIPSTPAPGNTLISRVRGVHFCWIHVFFSMATPSIELHHHGTIFIYALALDPSGRHTVHLSIDVGVFLMTRTEPTMYPKKVTTAVVGIDQFLLFRRRRSVGAIESDIQKRNNTRQARLCCCSRRNLYFYHESSTILLSSNSLAHSLRLVVVGFAFLFCIVKSH
jgi:hypothetical protein